MLVERSEEEEIESVKSLLVAENTLKAIEEGLGKLAVDAMDATVFRRRLG